MGKYYRVPVVQMSRKKMAVVVESMAVIKVHEMKQNKEVYNESNNTKPRSPFSKKCPLKHVKGRAMSIPMRQEVGREVAAALYVGD